MASILKNNSKKQIFGEVLICVSLGLLFFYLILYISNNNLIGGLSTENFSNSNTSEGTHKISLANTVKMSCPQIEVKPSPLLDNKERGLFAAKNFKKHDVIEVCPTLIMKKEELAKDNIINEHLFKGRLPGNSLLSLGYGSIINHSKEKQNCTWFVAPDDSYIKFIAIKDISAGEELYSNYGDNYWKSRKYQEM